MGFVKTREELDRYYGLGVRRFEGARMLGAMYTADAEVAAALLPPPLQPSDMPGGLLFIAEYPETNLGPGYREAAIFLRCEYDGEAGSYCLSMPIDNEARNYNGRDIFGFPKRMATIGIERDGDRATGWVERHGIRFVEMTVNAAADLPAMPPMGPTFLFKASPRIDLQPGFDGPVLLCKQRTEIEMIECRIGTAELSFTPAEHDPWHELASAEVTMAFDLLSNNTMLPGEVVAEVDGDAFLPYYFKMTDFSAGKA